jgi:hypothetical protein
MSYLLAFKAGRAFRRDGTNFVDPSPTKGAIMLQNADDGLLHFLWKDRSTNEIIEDLILFPSDATFVKVSQSSWGRTYVLKFSSSNQRHFFWMQDASSRKDDEFVRNINRYLENPEYIPVWDTRPSQPEASTSTSQPSTSSQPPAGPFGTAATPEQLAQLRSIVDSMSGNVASAEPELALTDILTPANLNPLFTAYPDLIPALFPHLPPDLPTPLSPEVLQRIINSPQFRSAVRSFDQALRTGLLGNLVTGLGLPEEAGTGIEAFLNAVQEQAGRVEGENEMDTD